METGVRLTREEAMLNLLQEVYGITALPEKPDRQAKERARTAKQSAFESAKKEHWRLP